MIIKILLLLLLLILLWIDNDYELRGTLTLMLHIVFLVKLTKIIFSSLVLLDDFVAAFMKIINWAFRLYLETKSPKLKTEDT